MYPNARPSETASLLDSVHPAAIAASTVTSGWISAASAHRFLALINTGALGSSATLDAKLEQAKDSSGTSAKDITGKAITQIVKASGDNKQAMINLRPEELDVNNAFTHFRLSMTVGTATSTVAANIFGFVTRNAPASASNNAAVVQVVG